MRRIRWLPIVFAFSNKNPAASALVEFCPGSTEVRTFDTDSGHFFNSYDNHCAECIYRTYDRNVALF